MGGTSTEREISLSTGEQILAALDRTKYLPVAMDTAMIAGIRHDHDGQTFQSDAMSTLLLNPKAGAPDIAFIALHGKGGEDGSIQGLMELMGIPYTGSGILASALALDKAMTKKILHMEGIPVPKDILARRSSSPHHLCEQAEKALGYPMVIKPNTQGSTVGCNLVKSRDEFILALQAAWELDQLALIEQFVSGTEITVGLLGNRKPEVLPILEIVPKSGFYDYETKYTDGGAEHIIPARLSEEAAVKARDYAARCHTTLGCRGMSRVDMIVSDNQPYVLEINTIPGMTPTSLLPDMAKAAGIDFSQLLDKIIILALEKE